MKKLFLSLVAAIVAATTTYAQSSLVATLSHGATTTAYYGPNALVQANDAATDGDVITLSSGTFSGTTITKGITLRGAGVVWDLDNQKEPTIISGELTLDNGDKTMTEHLIIEGICSYDGTIVCVGTLDNALFIKNKFFNFKMSSSSSRLNECYFSNCIFMRSLDIDGDYNSFVNCIVWSTIFFDDADNSSFTNCVININSSSYCTFRNCILLVNQSLDSTNTAFKCISSYRDKFSYMPNNTNQYVEWDNLFKYPMDGYWNDSFNFELTDEAKTKYLGTDGTEVGIYGGEQPFNLTPSNPQITKFDMTSSAENGKLTVKINVQ